MREDDANNRLRRRGASGAAGGVGASGSGGGSARGRSRAAASLCHGGRPAAGGGSDFVADAGNGSDTDAPGTARPGNTGLTRTSPGAADPASRRAMPFSSTTTT
ncbi:hypothetical protein JQ563_20515 [Bradyrhizobium liaoningense]|nr:hypothetical protein [Bradyrhizobium liaoningense]MBR0943481.1 hypothetical protein [Bradyrhizobium liaoningense]MBR1001420.1 hypothetical protein [Bradyrhizobium liaoningense]MBR1034643.1 hypothetical protein [Bradyrhizobium liaoningense]MBR1064517.1 hypothetical protein [Bradyrhizobium liaoningense]